MKNAVALLSIAIICRCCSGLPKDDQSLEEDIETFLLADEDLKRDLFLQTQPYSSGENFLNDTSPDVVLDMMFHHQDKQDMKALDPSSRNVATKFKDKSQNENRELSDRFLKNLAKVFARYNASILLANSTLVVTKQSTTEPHLVILRIDGDIVIRIDDMQEAFPTLTTSDKSKIDGLIERYNKTSPLTNETQSMRFCEVENLQGVQLDEIRQFVRDGYLNEQVLADVENGKLSADDSIKPLMKNKEFILYQFPDKVSEMLEDERIPSNVEQALFSGTYSLGELKRMVYNDDSIAKALLPNRLRELLEDRSPPTELKEFLHCGHNHTTILGLTMENKTLVESLMSDSMFYFYTLFRVQRNVILNMAMSGTTILALVCVMTSLGCTMTVKEIMVHVKRPKGVLIALVSQYGVMPAAAFALTQLFGLGVYPSIAILICGCCPGGNLSNILAFAINGDMNLSILMTTCSSVLGLAMMPLLLYCYSRFIIPIDGAEIVPFGKIILNIVLTILPVSIGIAIKHYRPTWTKVIMRFGAIMLLLCSIAFSVMAGFLLGDRFFSFFPTSVVYCAAILPVTGYVLGFILARLVRENQKCSRTISVETGCQNVQLCGTVLKLAFDPVLIGAMMLLPIIYMLFQAGEATLLISLYRLYERLCGKRETSDTDDETKFDDEDKKLECADSEIKQPDDNKSSPTIKSGKERKKNTKTNPSQGEDWPLVPTDMEDAFENSKENYV